MLPDTLRDAGAVTLDPLGVPGSKNGSPEQLASWEDEGGASAYPPTGPGPPAATDERIALLHQAAR